MISLHRFTLLVCFGLLLSFNAHSQSSFWVFKGKVVENNQSPIEFANVYINNTSVGTTTGADGHFTLHVPKSIQKIELVVSSIGYYAIKEILSPKDANKELIFLLETNNLLNEVKVTAKHDYDWRKKWRIFKNGLLGESYFTNDCEILNPNDIQLEYDSHKKVIASSNKPIYIRNDALGYKIMFQMTKFVSDGTKTFFSGDKFFEKLTPKDEKQANRWKKNQQRGYKDTFRSFLVALSQNKLEENGYAVFTMKKLKRMYYGKITVAAELADSALADCKAAQILTVDSATHQYYFHAKQTLLVFLTNRFNPTPVFLDYPYKYSQIDLPHNYLIFLENGWISQPNGIILHDFWGHEGFSNLLPDDFIDDGVKLEKETTESVLAVNLPTTNDSLQKNGIIPIDHNFWALTGKVVNNSQIPVPKGKVYINNTTLVTNLDTAGKFTLKIPVKNPSVEIVIAAEGFVPLKNSLSFSEIAQKLEEDSTKFLTFSVDSAKVLLKTANFVDKEWQKKWKIFNETLLGESSFTKDCVVANPEDVNIEYDEDKKLTVVVHKPLIINNKALGYKVEFQPTKFNYEDKNYVTGTKFFENLVAPDLKQSEVWKKNQQKAYQYSLRHFLLSLAQNKLEENGFQVFQMRKIKEIYEYPATVRAQVADSSFHTCKAAEIFTLDKSTNRYYLRSAYPLLIFFVKRHVAFPDFMDYPYKYSQIVLPKGYLEFAENGWLADSDDLLTRGYWREDGIARSLPANFVNDPKFVINEELEQLLASEKDNTLEDNEKVISQGSQFNKKGLQVEEKKDFNYGAVADYTIKVKESDYTYTIFDLLKRIPGLRVISQPNGDVKVYFAGNSPSLQGGTPNPSVALVLDGNYVDDPEMVVTMLNSLDVKTIDNIGVVKFGNSAIFGARGASGTLIITTKK